jgi:hypothetical protein
MGSLLLGNAHIEGYNIQPLRIAAGCDGGFNVRRNLRRLELVRILEQGQLDAGELQIRQSLQRHWQGQIEKTLRRGSYKHR